MAANDGDDGTEDEGDDPRRRRQSRGNSSGACGVADIAGATGARVRVSGHSKRGEGVGQGRGVRVRRRHWRGAVVPICKDWAAPSDGSDASDRGGHDALIKGETLEP